MLNDEKKILIGQKAIMDYIGIQSIDLFKHFVRSGLPAKIIKRRWYAHKDNVETYFKNITGKRVKSIPDDAD